MPNANRSENEANHHFGQPQLMDLCLILRIEEAPIDLSVKELESIDSLLKGDCTL
jgi:hypothetical protein